MKEELWINEETAQLIFDALAWSNKDWHDSLDWSVTDEDTVSESRADFIRFCRARGIAGVKKCINL